ncbi:hypothetical protein BDW71DRAFT_164186 [Aspergillus fruticulosus]
MGVDIMIAGLAFQVAALTLFIALAAEFAWRLRRRSESRFHAGNGEEKARYTEIRRHKWWSSWPIHPYSPLQSLCEKYPTDYGQDSSSRQSLSTHGPSSPQRRV